MDSPRCMLAEAIGTFFLCFAGIGAILSTQAPLNCGAGLVVIALDLHWCYWTAPIAGAVVAALMYDNFLLSDET